MSYCVIICVPTKKIYPRLGGSLPKKSARLMVVLTALLLMLGRGGGLKGDRPNRLATPNIARGMVGRGRALLFSLSWKQQQKGINKSRKKEVMLVITNHLRPTISACYHQTEAYNRHSYFHVMFSTVQARMISLYTCFFHLK